MPVELVDVSLLILNVSSCYGLNAWPTWDGCNCAKRYIRVTGSPFNMLYTHEDSSCVGSEMLWKTPYMSGFSGKISL